MIAVIGMSLRGGSGSSGLVQFITSPCTMPTIGPSRFSRFYGSAAIVAVFMMKTIRGIRNRLGSSNWLCRKGPWRRLLQRYSRRHADILWLKTGPIGRISETPMSSCGYSDPRRSLYMSQMACRTSGYRYRLDKGDRRQGREGAGPAVRQGEDSDGVSKAAPYEKMSELLGGYWKRARPSASPPSTPTSLRVPSVDTRVQEALGKKEPMVITPWWRKGTTPRLRSTSRSAPPRRNPRRCGHDSGRDRDGHDAGAEQPQEAETNQVDRPHHHQQSRSRRPMEEGEDLRPQGDPERGRGSPEEHPHFRQRQGEEPPES